ncbi:MAG: putative Ig domain-containing protein [Ignavibacteriota bacterium]
MACDLAGWLADGTPPATGTFSFTLKVTDSAGVNATKTFSLKINAMPAVTTTSLPATTAGLVYSQTLTASGGTGAYTFSAAGLPTWLTISGSTLTGTAPLVSTATPFRFSLTVADSTGAVGSGQTLSITVNPGIIVTTSNPLSTAASAAPYSQTFAVTGGTGAIAWTFGNRPSWLTQNGATLGGTAPAVTQPTPYTFTATATDSLGATSGAEPFTVTVSSGVIVTTAATLGAVDRHASLHRHTCGGRRHGALHVQRRWSDAAPVAHRHQRRRAQRHSPFAGSFSFTIKAVDSLNASSTKNFTLAVNPQPSVTTTSLPPLRRESSIRKCSLPPAEHRRSRGAAPRFLPGWPSVGRLCTALRR